MSCSCAPVQSGSASQFAAGAPPANATPPVQSPKSTSGGASGAAADGVAQLGTTAPDQLLWPIKGRITSEYGHVSTIRNNVPHTGLDISAATGTEIKAAADGVVDDIQWQPGGGGNVTIIRHAGGLRTVYAHQSAIDVKEGQQISAGQEIGKVGSTGNSTGPHLHFGVQQGKTDVDPDKYLPGQ